MSKPRSRVAAFAVYLVVRIIVCLIQSLSIARARSFALGLAWVAYHFDRRHRFVALDNLRHAFPGQYTDEQLDELVRDVYRHFCSVVFDMVFLPRKLHVHTWRRYMNLSDGRLIVGCLLSDRPLMVVTGHFGNWEMAGYAMGLLGFKTYAIARTLDNPYLEEFLHRFREKTGQMILDKNGSADRIQEILASGGVVATLADQDAGQRGQFVDFFARPASTHKAVALLSLKHRVPLLVVGTPKVSEPIRHAVEVGDLILPEEYDGQRDVVKSITQRFSTALEHLVRRHPEQYFWLHRRWKHQPKAKAAKKAA